MERTTTTAARPGGSSWYRSSALQWTLACGLACLVMMIVVSSEESWAYLSASVASASPASPPRAGQPPSLLQVETAQVRAHAGGGCHSGGRHGDGDGVASCPWAYRRADDVEAAPRRAPCHKQKRLFTDRPKAAGICAVHIRGNLGGGGGGGGSGKSGKNGEDNTEGERVFERVSSFVKEWTAAGLGEEVVVVLTGGGEDDEDSSDAGTAAAAVAALTDRLMTRVLVGENHHLVYTPQALTPSQALDRGLRMAVSPVAVLSVGESTSSSSSSSSVGGGGGGGGGGGACFKALLKSLKRNPDVAVVGAAVSSSPSTALRAAAAAAVDGEDKDEELGLAVTTAGEISGRSGGERGGSGGGGGKVTSGMVPDGGGPLAVRRGALMGLGVHEGCGAGSVTAAAARWKRGGNTGEWVRAAAAAGASTGVLVHEQSSCGAAVAAAAASPAELPDALGCPGRRTVWTHLSPERRSNGGGGGDTMAKTNKRRRKKEKEEEEEERSEIGGDGRKGAVEKEGKKVSIEDACAAFFGRNLTVSYGVNYFKRPELFKHLPGALVDQPDLAEVLINDDSLDAATAWLSAIQSQSQSQSQSSDANSDSRRKMSPHALVRSHDLHEVRGMNRLIAYSDADIVVLAQDDDLPPAAADGGGDVVGSSSSLSARGQWLAEIRALFCRHPKLALVGGKRGFKPHPSAERLMSKPLKSFGYGWWKKMRSLPTKPISHRDPTLDLPFMFVTAVNMGPLVVRRGAFLSVGMFHEATSCVGESGIQFDAELGLRLWEHGWQVGLYESGFRLGYEDGNDFGGEGTHGGSQWKIREENDKFNQRLMWDMYGEKRLKAIASKVSKANKGLEAKPSTNRYFI